MSLLISSDGLQPDQREEVQKAIAVLEQHGFNREVSSQTSDRLSRYGQLVNRYVGHRDAYGRHELSFLKCNVYPEFSPVPVDDNERAASCCTDRVT